MGLSLADRDTAERALRHALASAQAVVAELLAASAKDPPRDPREQA